jgi:hypothetical protein
VRDVSREVRSHYGESGYTKRRFCCHDSSIADGVIALEFKLDLQRSLLRARKRLTCRERERASALESQATSSQPRALPLQAAQSKWPA